jgi:Holliday junction resolvasome RuvABC endonuclease subunit
MKTITFGNPIGNGSPVAVGIDQSYGGFAISILEIPPQAKFFTAVAKNSEFKGVERLAELRSFLLDTLEGHVIKDVAMEGYAYSATMGHTMGELGGMVKIALFDTFGIKPIIVAPATLKKYITGKGTGVQKNQILLNVYKKWDVEFTDDNAADSYGLARIAAGISDLSYEKSVLDGLKDPKFR